MVAHSLVGIDERESDLMMIENFRESLPQAGPQNIGLRSRARPKPTLMKSGALSLKIVPRRRAIHLELEKQIDTLEHFPEICPLIPENELLGTKYRHLLYGSYRTIFRISEDSVYGLRVIHGARLLDTSFFES